MLSIQGWYILSNKGREGKYGSSLPRDSWSRTRSARTAGSQQQLLSEVPIPSWYEIALSTTLTTHRSIRPSSTAGEKASSSARQWGSKLCVSRKSETSMWQVTFSWRWRLKAATAYRSSEPSTISHRTSTSPRRPSTSITICGPLRQSLRRRGMCVSRVTRTGTCSRCCRPPRRHIGQGGLIWCLRNHQR